LQARSDCRACANPWSYAVYRAIETFLGIAMAVLVSVIPKLLRVEAEDETGG